MAETEEKIVAAVRELSAEHDLSFSGIRYGLAIFKVRFNGQRERDARYFSLAPQNVSAQNLRKRIDQVNRRRTRKS